MGGKFQSRTIDLPHSTAPSPILIIPSVRLGSNKDTFLSHWFDSARCSNPTTYQNGRWALNSFGHRICIILSCMYSFLSSLGSSATRPKSLPCQLNEIKTICKLNFFLKKKRVTSFVIEVRRSHVLLH